MSKANAALVYYNKETIKHKKLEDLSEETVASAFGTSNIEVYTSSKELLDHLLSIDWNNKNLLMMSSGNFDGIDFDDLGSRLVCAL